MNVSRQCIGWIFGAIVIASTAATADANISMRINRVGPFSGSPYWVRDGVLSFVEVDVRNVDSAPFEGILRATQTDRDGDVVVSELPIAVAPDGEWESKELYFVPNEIASNGQIIVKLYSMNDELIEFADELGQPVKSLTSNGFLNTPDKDSHLVVTMMSGTRLSHEVYLKPATQDLPYTDLICGRELRSIAPRELPRKGQGLAAIDALIWEDADPAEISPEQAEALMAWVREGGRLLLTVNSHWQSFHNSPLAEILPASIVDIADVRSIPAFKDIIGTQSEYDEFARIYRRFPVTRCRMRPHAEALSIPSRVRPDGDDDAAEDLEPIAYRRFVGRGMVTLLGARLSDLMPTPRLNDADDPEDTKRERARFAKMVDKVVANNLLALPVMREAKASAWGFEQRINLYSFLTRSIGFSAVTGVFLVFAIGFTAIYTFVATIGSYLYLNKKGWGGYCWSAFAAVSIVGVVIGLGMVWVLRGFSTKLWQTSIVDARAGVNYGYGTCLFGVKTKDHTRLDLKLPVGYANEGAGQGPIFPLPKAIDNMTGGETSFVASDTYRLEQAATLIEGVPVRATLKEFEGRWHGELGGTIEARLIYDEKTKQFTEDSYIRNELGVTLDDCFLFEGDQEIAGERGRSTGIRCHQLNRLGDKGESANLAGEALFKRLYDKGTLDSNGDPELRKGADLYLTEFLDTWKRKIGAVSSLMGQPTQVRNIATDVEHAPYLLLSVYNLIDPSGSTAAWNLQRSFGRRLDCSHWITRHTAVLIGFSMETPPAVLQIDRANERPERALTMYRFLIPVERK